MQQERKKEKRNPSNCVCVSLPQKRFTQKFVFKTMKKKKKRKREKKKRGPIQRNYIISSWFTTGPETQNKATITKRSNRQQQASKQAAALPQQWQPENKRLKKADSPEIKTKNKKEKKKKKKREVDDKKKKKKKKIVPKGCNNAATKWKHESRCEREERE
jgi:hypothetical protein